jgi:hypothetical protein
MLMRQETVEVDSGTSTEFIDAATLGVRLAIRRLQALGLDAATIRRRVLKDLDVELTEEDLNPWCHETVMTAVSLAVDDALEVPMFVEELDVDGPEFDIY